MLIGNDLFGSCVQLYVHKISFRKSIFSNNIFGVRVSLGLNTDPGFICVIKINNFGNSSTAQKVFWAWFHVH